MEAAATVHFLIQTASAVAMVAIGWWVVHALNSSRDLRNERRKFRTGYLLEAYRKLEAAVIPTDKSVTRPGVESAIADIQLLGTPEQVRLAQAFAREMAQSSEASLNQLLAGLRTSLRTELQLEPVEGKILHLRFTDDKKLGSDSIYSE